jgi:uncharacterized membrane protein YhaH (DUF805 family)
MEIAQSRPSVVALAFQPLRDMLVFSGRSTRTEVVAFFVLGVLANIFTIRIGGPGATLLDAAKVAWALLWAFPWIALFVRRLHDQERSARWALLLIAPFLLDIASSSTPMETYYANWPGVSLSMSYPATLTPETLLGMGIGMSVAILSLVLFLLPGTPGANRYGPDPREGWRG